MARYCGNCGTEVDESAVFCPTCGRPIEDGESGDMPAAPAWPDGASEDEFAAPVDRTTDAAVPPRDVEPRWRDEPEPEPEFADVPTRVEQRPPPPEPDGGPVAHEAPPPAAAEPRADSRQRSDDGPPRTDLPRVDLPITTPVTVSGWLIGIGSVLAVLGLIVILVGTALNVIDLLLLLALLGVAAMVWFAARLPAVPHLRLATLVIALIAFGVALDRVGFRGGGVGELLLFLGSAAAAMGAIILELGQDQPLGGAQR